MQNTSESQIDEIENLITQSYLRYGINRVEWMPEAGFSANSETMYNIYLVYQKVYSKAPEKFMWMGLARMTGGQVLYGMQNLVRIAKDPCAVTQHIVGIAKDIFERMLWQHDLYLENKPLLFELCDQLNANFPAPHAYKKCWENIDSGKPDLISLGNKMLLENEQHATVQHHYDEARKESYSRIFLFLTRFIMRKIHPYHNRFILNQPLGDVTHFEDRWKWIEGEKGMWKTWANLSPDERNRLINLDNEAIIRHHWLN